MTTPGAGRSSIGVRVRPNADNFIRDLKAQLKTKRATYWVDVKANMGPANKDVKAWAAGGLKAFDPKIPVGASMLQATQDLNKWKNLQRDNKTNIPIGVDMTAAQRELSAWRQAAKRDLEIPVKLNVRDLDAALERASKRRVKAEVQVEGDTKPLERQLNGLFLPGGGFREIKIPVDADTTGVTEKVEEVKAKAKADPVELAFKADMAQIDREMKQLQLLAKAKKLGIEVTPDVDPKKLKLQMAKLRLEEARKKISIEVDVKRRNIENLKRLFDRLEGSVGSIATLRSIDLGPITLGKPTGLISTLTTITALAGLVPALVTGMSALSDVFMRVAGAASILPGAIGGIVASMLTLSVGSQGVGDAFSAMFDMWTEGASAQRTAANSLVQSQNSYRNAVVDETKAQRDVGRARRDALGDLRELNNELRGSVLNEAQAILDAQKARDRYAKGLAEGFDSETDRLQGLLDIAKADEDIIGVRERNIGLQNKVNDANKQGIEGSDRVTDALEAQTRASQATAAAATALAEANAGSGTAAEKFADALGLLSPNAREFVLAFAGMKGELFDFRNALQDTLFQGLGPALQQTFRDLLPVVGPGMQEIAAAMNQNILQVFDTLSSPGGQNIIERILGGTAEAQRSLNGLIDPLVRGLGTLMAAGAEHLPQVIDLFTKLADRFSNFIQEADRNGTLDKFMDEGIDALANFAELGINALKIINDFATAFKSEFGEDLLTMLVRITGEWHKFLSSEEGQKKLTDFIKEAKDLWNDWRPILEDLPELFGKVSDAAKILIDAITPFLNLFSSVMKEAPWLVEGFILAWGGAKFLGVLSTIGTSFTTILKGMKGLAAFKPPAWLANLPGGPGTGGAAATPKPGAKPGGPAGSGGGGGAAGRIGRILGPLGIVATGIMEVKNEADLARVYDEYKKQRDAAPGDAEKREIDKALYSSVGIDIGTGAYPDLSKFTFKSLAHAAQLTGSPAPIIVQDGKFIDVNTGSELPGFGVGGFTDWARSQGHPAMLHGREYIEPADTVAHYGVDAMEAIHHKRVPKGMLQGFQGGGMPMANPNWEQPDPMFPGQDPNWRIRVGWPDQDRWMPPPWGARPGPTEGATIPGWLTPGMGGGPGRSGQSKMPSFQPGGLFDPLHPLGPAPGPVDAAGNPTYSVDTSGGEYVPKQDDSKGFNLFGFNIPLGGPPQDSTRGWGPGGPPMGLGGGDAGPNGEAPFDMRKFGIGPGPPGSGPQDWMRFMGGFAGDFITGLAGSVISGGLGFLGLSGLTSSPLFQAATGLTEHFFNAPGFSPQAPGNADTNAAVSDLLTAHGGMPQNPPYPGYVANMPQVYDANGNLIPNAQVAREPYGLPGGSNVEQGGPGFPDWVYTTANQFGLKAATYGGHQETERADIGAAPNPQHQNRGIDWYGTPEQMRNFAAYLISSGLAEQVIYSDPETHQNYGFPANVDYSGDYGDHTGHVHTRFSGSLLGGAPGAVAPAPGGPTGIPGIDALNAALADSGAPPVDASGLPSDYHPTPSKSGSSGTRLAPRRGGPTSIGPQTASPQGFAYADKEGLKKIAHQMYLAAGLPANEWPAFDRLIQKESSWDPTAQNPKSTAHGLGQFLDSTSAQFGIPHGTNDPMVQLPAVFAYIQSRYGGSPVQALQFHNAHNWYDQGGWVPPGQTTINNGTGLPELVIPMASFAPGGFNRGVVPRPKPPPPLPRGPSARPITPAAPPVRLPPPPPPPVFAPPGPGMAPVAPGGPAVGPGAPPAPGPQRPTNEGRVGSLVPMQGGPAPSGEGMHLHPALQKGITSGFAAAGNAAAAAASFGLGGMGGGAGGMIGGLFQQAGKIATNIANVGASFLVGNITAGTTDNAYGVTQQGSHPSGGTRIVDNSSHIGSIQTANLDEYYRRENLRQSQRAQGALGHWGR